MDDGTFLLESLDILLKIQWFPVSVPLQRMTMTLCSASKNLDTMGRGSLQMADLIGAYQDRATGLRPEFDLILVGGFKIPNILT